MADNTTLNAGTGGDTIATDDISSVKHQRVKIEYGADGSATDVSFANPCPIKTIPEIAALGDEATMVAWNRFGRNEDVDAAGIEDVWTAGSTWMGGTPNASAETVNLVSTNAGDDGSPVGVGARTVEVYGLDGSYAVQSETVTMDGITNAPTANTYMVVYRLVVATVGSNGANAGVITATGATSGKTYAHIPIGDNQTLQATHTIPDGKTGLVYSYYGGVDSLGAAANVTFTLYQWDADDYALWRPTHQLTATTGNMVRFDFGVPYKVGDRTHIKLQADSDTNNTIVFGGFDLVVVG